MMRTESCIFFIVNTYDIKAPIKVLLFLIFIYDNCMQYNNCMYLTIRLIFLGPWHTKKFTQLNVSSKEINMFDLLLLMLLSYGIYCQWPICLLLIFYCSSLLYHGYYVMALRRRRTAKD